MKTQARIAWSIAFVLVISLSAAALASADPGRPPHAPPPGQITPIAEQPIMPMAQEEFDPGGGWSSYVAEGGCESESRNPHTSSHFDTRVNAESYIICSVPTVVTLHAKLYKEFAWLWWWPLDDQWRTDIAAPVFDPGFFVNADCQGDLNYRLVTWAYPEGMNSGGTMNTQYVPCQSNP